MNPTVGRIVHYVLPDESPSRGAHRPAIIVRVWSATCVQLQVFMDGGNDIGPNYPSQPGGQNIRWETSVMYDETKASRTWHWPEVEE